MQTGPGYQTSCWQLHSIQLVPRDLGSQPVPTHKSLCRLKHVEYSSGFLSPLRTRMPANLLHLRILPRQSSNKHNTQKTKKKRRERKTTKSLLSPLPFFMGEKNFCQEKSHDPFIIFILTAFIFGIQGLLVYLFH